MYTDPAVRDVLLQTLRTLRQLLSTLRPIRDEAINDRCADRLLWAISRMTAVQEQIDRLARDLEVDPDQ